MRGDHERFVSFPEPRLAGPAHAEHQWTESAGKVRVGIVNDRRCLAEPAPAMARVVAAVALRVALRNRHEPLATVPGDACAGDAYDSPVAKRVWTDVAPEGTELGITSRRRADIDRRTLQ